MQRMYIFVDGVMKVNPDYRAESAQSSSLLHPNSSLAIVSSTDHVIEATEVRTEVLGSPMQMAPNVVQSMQAMEDPAYLAQFKSPQALNGGEMLNGLTRLFAQYEIPIGLLSKLLPISNYHLNFMIDDSGSMARDTDALMDQATIYIRKRYDMDGKRAKNKMPMTRWEEAEDRLHIMIEMLQYVPAQSIQIRFLNNPAVIQLEQRGKSPAQFADEAHQAVMNAFSHFASGSTPIYQCLDTAFKSAPNNTMHFLFTDGEPDGGSDNVAHLIRHRRHPEFHPLTLVSCTNDNDEVKWMKKVEGKAKFTSEMDDFKSERKEVNKKQGKAFPYSKGFWLLCHLVSAINPYDLDALDEKYPLTHKTLNELMGRMLSGDEYTYYFNNHPKANDYAAQFHLFAREDLVAIQIIDPSKPYMPTAPIYSSSVSPVLYGTQTVVQQTSVTQAVQPTIGPGSYH